MSGHDVRARRLHLQHLGARIQSDIHARAARQRILDETVTARPCARCGESFGLTAGELRFAEATGVEPPTTCHRCRPTRREALAHRMPR